MTTFRLRPRGPFSLAAAAAFGRDFTPSPTAGEEGALRTAFASQAAGWRTLGVEIRGRGAGVEGTVVGPASADDVAAARDDVRRILSLDVDGSGFPAVGARDPVVGALQAAHPGLRPVLFRSPYEAAAWALIGQRISGTQARRVSDGLARELGERVVVAGEALHAFPAPARLAALEHPWPGLSERKVTWLRALAAAALQGDLEPAALRRPGAEEALAQLQQLPGIGPFAAELVLIRGAGHPDHFPRHEPRVHAAMRAAYDLPAGTPAAGLEVIARGWAPFRSWVALLLRLGQPR